MSRPRVGVNPRVDERERGSDRALQIHPDVLKATCEELDEAGWGYVQRCFIPASWKTQRPVPKTERRRIPKVRANE